MRLIDADKIEWYGCNFEDGKECIRYNGNCDVCPFAECDADKVRKLPTIEAQPVIHAKWIWDESRFMYVCSNCKGNPTEMTGYSHDYPVLASHYHYCKDCGAKMDKE